MEGQKRNTAQLARIGAIVEQRWGLKKNPWDSDKESKKKDRDNEEGSKDGSRKSQEEVEEETLSSISC